MFKEFTDLFVMVIIFISVYFTNKQDSIVLIKIHFNKQECTVFPPPANQYDTRHVFIAPQVSLSIDLHSSPSAD